MLARRNPFFFLSVSCVLGACAKGGSGGAAPVPELKASSATVLSTTPPAGASDVDIGALILALFSEDMSPSSFTTATFSATDARENPSQLSGSVSYDAATRTATFTPSSPLKPDRDYLVTLDAGIRDASERPFAPFSWTFRTLDDIHPEVTAVNPACDTVNLSPQSVFCVDFSEPVDPATVSGSTFRLQTPGQIGQIGKGLSWANVAGTVALREDRMSACFTPRDPLRVNKDFRINLSSGIADDAGLGLVPFLCGFKTLDVTAPRVSSVVPEDGETSVAVGTTVRANFSEELSAPSINPSSLTLRDSGGSLLPGSLVLSPQGTNLTFKPDSRLTYGATYTATVDAGVQDLTGNVLGADFVWTFETAFPFAPPVLVETDDANSATDVRLAIDAGRGRVYAVWLQKNGGDLKRRVYSNVFVSGTGWTGVLPVSAVPTSTFTDAASAEVDVDVDPGSTGGMAFATWLVKDPANGDSINQVYAATLPLNGPAWSAPQKITNVTNAAAFPPLVSVERSSLVAPRIVYVQKGAAPENFQNLHASTYDMALGTWSAPELISDNLAVVTTGSISLTVDTNLLKVYAAFLESSPANGDTTANVYVNVFSGGAWSGQTRLSDNLAPASVPKIVANPFEGRTIATWLEKVPATDSSTNIYSRDFDPGTGTWSTQFAITDDAASASSPLLAADRASGNFLALWIQNNQIYSNTFQGGAGNNLWPNSPKLVSDNSAPCTSPTLAFDPAGGAGLAMWVQRDPNPPNLDTVKNVYFSFLANPISGTWDPKLRASTDAGTDTDLPVVAGFRVGSTNFVLGVWEEENPAVLTKTNIVSSLLTE